MFKSFKIGAILGIPITIHWSLLILAGWLVTSSYRLHGGGDALETLILVIGVFACVVAHEFGHILAARMYGIETRSINLSPLGGIAFLDRYPEKPGGRVLVALAGPAVSVVLAIVFLAWAVFAFEDFGLDTVVGKLFAVTTGIVLFNLLPIYPMDGGHVLSAILTKLGGDQLAAKVSLYTAQVASLVMIAVGAWFSMYSLLLIGGFIFLAVSF